MTNMITCTTKWMCCHAKWMMLFMHHKLLKHHEDMLELKVPSIQKIYNDDLQKHDKENVGYLH